MHPWKQRPAEMQKKCKKKCRQNAKKMQTKCKKMQMLQETANFPDFCGFGNARKLFAFFFAFRPASVSRVAFFLHFGRPLFPGLHFFAFWPAVASRIAFFCILVVLSRGLGNLSPRKCKKNAMLNSNRAANTKKRKQQMQKKCNIQKNANSKCQKNAK